MKLYALQDKKAKIFGGVFVAMNDGHVGRFMQERFEGREDTVARYPEDFDLYELGEMDDLTGKLAVNGVHPRFVVNMAVILNGGKNA